MNPIPIEALNLPTKWRRAAQATITAEGLALCHDHADELQAALGVDAQASSMEAWSTHMAQKESGQIVTAGAHGLEDGPEDPVTPPNQTLDEALRHAGDPVSRLNQALGEAFKDDPANACRAHAAVLPLVVELAGVDARFQPSTSGATDTDSNPKPGRTKSCDDPDCGCGTPVFTHPKEALEFLSGRFKFAGVSHSVALAYASDIDAILSRMGKAGDQTTQAQGKDEVTGITPTTDYLAGINAALRAIASIPMVDANAQLHGHEDAYRAVEALAKGAVDETVRVQDAWEWAGGNPGIQASREDLKQALNDLDAVCDEADARPSTPPPASQDSAAVAAVAFALQTDQGMDFLRLWNEGEFDALRREWPEAPEAIYIGADPLHKPAPKRNAP